MSPDCPLRFDFVPSDDDVARNNGWGHGSLYVLGVPYWYANNNAQPEPIEWTWVDFLEYVAANWGALAFEQSYPFPWLNEAAHPGDVWNVAERRWARLGEDIADAEELAVLAFERRHNLASAWKGLSLPSLTLMRNGKMCWVYADGLPPLIVPFDECRRALVSICETLAQCFEGSSNSGVANAVDSWRNRGRNGKTEH
ncbi:hypothetical protein [Bordetella sp. LUAb4]|uniref:hypothetical protein n=1 Tax=Bordetella sp. LUAb4 TaxID=2843195 RepID=UPI001E4DAC17|nr:hypothetical protein [Bordetella sp. LUAb4]